MQQVWMCGFDSMTCEKYCQSLQSLGICGQGIHGSYAQLVQNGFSQTVDAVVLSVSRRNAGDAAILCKSGFCSKLQKAPVFAAVIAQEDPVLVRMLKEAGFAEILVAPVSDYLMVNRLQKRLQDRARRLQIDQQMERERCRTLLLRAGCPTHMRGFDCLLECLLLVLEKQDRVWSATKEIYPEAAKKMDCSASTLERSIRAMLQCCPINNIAALKQEAAYANQREQSERISITEFLTLARIILDRQIIA